MLDFIYISFIGIAVICSYLFTTPETLSQYKLLRVFLIVTLVNEIVCYFMKQQRLNTLVNYNFYYYFRFTLLAFIYARFFERGSVISYTIRCFYVLTAVLFCINIYLYNGFLSIHTTYLVTGSLFVIILALCRFYSILENDKPLSPLYYPFFWISTGFFFFFLMIIPFLGVINFLISKDMILASQKLIITKSMSIFLYLLISADYYIQWKRRKLIY